jgi:hypothetical protein
MSVHVSSNVWRSCPQKHDRLLLMLALADYSNDEGVCWPSLKSLAGRIRGTRRGVQRMLDALIADGEVELVEMGGGRGQPSRYLLERYSEGGVLTDFRKGDPERTKGDPQATKGAIDLGQSVPERQNHQRTPTLEAEVVNIYEAYPLKKGRPAALRAIRAALKKIDTDTLLARTQAFAKARNGDLAYCPNPATWFNQERFNDDPSTWGRTSGDKRARGTGSLNSKSTNADAAGDY